MKQGKIIKAIGALERVSNQRMPLKVSYSLFKLQQSLQPAMDYQAQREKELIDEFPPSETNGNRLTFDNPENGIGFNKGMKELAEMESDVTFTPVRIGTDCQIDISMEDIAALEEFVVFADEEDKKEG